MTLPPVRVGLLGLGTVGGGTLTVLRRNADEITRRAGRSIEVTHAAVRDPDKARGVALDGIRLTSDPFAVVRDPDLAIVCELIGGLEPARSLVLEAIAHGKHVVTANKALIAEHGNELFAAARDAGVTIAFEAAVAGGIPVIKAIREALTGNRIEWLAGIINGTSNFILSQMRDEGAAFDAALAEAQALGYAEADPTFDIDGTDAAQKLTILAAIAFGIPLQPQRVYREGIAGLERADIAFAERFGYVIKHLGIARRTDEGLELRVHPTLVPRRRMLANVDGVMNAVEVCGDAVGPMLLYGPGAGAEPTASSVVADLVDVVRTLTTDPENRVPHLAFQPDALADEPLLAPDRFESAWYLRMNAQDRPGVLADVTRILADLEISIEAIVQQEPEPGAQTVPVVLLTHPVPGEAMARAIERIEELASVAGPVTRIRMESLA